MLNLCFLNCGIPARNELICRFLVLLFHEALPNSKTDDNSQSHSVTELFVHLIFDRFVLTFWVKWIYMFGFSVYVFNRRQGSAFSIGEHLRLKFFRIATDPYNRKSFIAALTKCFWICELSSSFFIWRDFAELNCAWIANDVFPVFFKHYNWFSPFIHCYFNEGHVEMKHLNAFIQEMSVPPCDRNQHSATLIVAQTELNNRQCSFVARCRRYSPFLLIRTHSIGKEYVNNSLIHLYRCSYDMRNAADWWDMNSGYWLRSGVTVKWS